MTALIGLLIALAALPGEALARRITTDEVENMRARVESRLNAYHRFDLAEREALEEGAGERASAFRDAKQKAHQEYIEENARFQKLQMDKREQDKRIEAQSQPSR
jgi:pyruvate/2-oxoacid:ferredoxin oxidoreductase beta subunit